MSLVEQALLRVKRSVGQDPQYAARNPVGPIATLQPPGETPSATRLTVDLNSMRAAGYLPEEEQDRQFADQYRQIKRPLIQKALATGAVEPRVIMVTSALPGDGKTFTSINLALSMARERDISVLLVDADFPKPHVSRIFGLQREPGMLEALVDENLSIESLVVSTDIRGFSLLPAGKPVDGSSELVSSERMRHLIKALCAHNPRRIVLLDSPPLLVTTEGRALVNLAGQLVLVVRAGQTPKQAVEEAISLFNPQQAGGIVLNEARMGVLDRYYGYGTYGTYGDANSPSR
jgi:protein-tyrosine kinase